MQISRVKLLETALRRSFQANAAVRRMILDGLDEGGPGGVEKIRAAYILAHPADLVAWSYLKDSSSAEIVRAAQKVIDRS